MRGASAPLTLFELPVPWPDGRALRRFGTRRLTGPRFACGSTARGSSTPTRRASRRTCAGSRCSRRPRSAASCCRSTRSRTRSGRRSARAATPDRVAVAMSGGVDSAVTLLKAGPEAVGVTLRLWLDPHGPDSERACCSPSAVIAARDACHARGLPHVTLDLREAFRRAVVTPFVRGYARGETPNPCIACNGGFRFAELLAFAKRVGAAKLATGHYARIVEHDGRLLLARGADPVKDQSYMLARLDPRLPRPHLVPARRADEGADARRGRGGRARSCRARREPGGVLPRRRRLPRVPRPAGPAGRRPARSSTSRASDDRRPTTASGASRPASGAGSASPRRSRSTRSAPSRARTRSSPGRARRSPADGSRHAAGSTCRSAG